MKPGYEWMAEAAMRFFMAEASRNLVARYGCQRRNILLLSASYPSLDKRG